MLANFSQWVWILIFMPARLYPSELRYIKNLKFRSNAVDIAVTPA